MKKLLLLLITFLLLGCVNTEPKKDAIEKLSYETIVEAQSVPVMDSVVIVTQGYKDYVFMKESGELVLKKEYISDDDWLDMPGIAFGLIIGMVFIAGLAIGQKI